MGDNLWSWSACDLVHAIRTRRVSAREAATSRALVEAVNPRIDGVVGALHGVPVAAELPARGVAPTVAAAPSRSAGRHRLLRSAGITLSIAQACLVGLVRHADAASLSLTAIDHGNVAFATFSSTSQHIGRNGHGTFVAFEVAANTAYTDQQQRVVWYDGDPGNPSTSRAVLHDARSVSNPLCIAAAPTGEVWAASGDWINNTVNVLKWRNVRDSTVPQRFSYPSDQGGAGKFSCAWDEARRVFLFVGGGFYLLRIDENGALKGQQKIVSYSSPLAPSYPNLAVGPDGHLDLSWVTVDLSHRSSAQYETIHYVQSRDGGESWSIDGAVPNLASPGRPVLGHAGGPTLLVSRNENANTFPTAMLADGNGGVHFTILHVPGRGVQLMADPARATTHHYKYNRSAADASPLAHARPLRGQALFPRASLGALIARRGEVLYILLPTLGHINVLSSLDWGRTWQDSAAAELPGKESVCALSFGGDRGRPDEPDIIALVGLWKNDCRSHVLPASFLGPTDIILVRFTP